MTSKRRGLLVASLTSLAAPAVGCGRAGTSAPAGMPTAPATTGTTVSTGATGTSGVGQGAQRWSAVVDAAFGGDDGAAVNGVRTYKTVAAALREVAPEGTSVANPYVVFVKSGRYREKLMISRPFTALVGESRDGTILTYDDTADSKTAGGATLGTSGSASVTVGATDFRAENLTIENAFDYLRNRAKPDGDPTKVANAQAVALKLERGSDRAVFRNVKITGYQDTLLVDAGRSYFRDCVIAGSTDFIFGAGTAVFDACEIVSRDLGSRTNNGYVTAGSTPLSSPYGFVFVDCRLRKESLAMADVSVALGRPWHPTTTLPDGSRAADPNAVASVIYLNCFMEGHVSGDGWQSMTGRDKEGQTINFLPKDARFFEYGSTGPGAIKSEARRTLSAAEAQQMTIPKVLGGWNPQAGAQ